VVIEYTLTYEDGGDHALRNVACVPEDDAQDEACDTADIPGSALDQWKTVDTGDEPVAAGSVLTYTLWFENTGSAAAAVDAVDHLAGVLDDADLTGEIVASEGLEAVADGDRIAITGSVAPGETGKVTYQTTVRGDDERGDDQAANFLVPAGEEPPATCGEADAERPDCTTTPIPRITATKTVDPETGATVVAGQDVTYTLTFANEGAAAGDVDYADDLSGVLDDADITAGPEASSDALEAVIDAD